MLRGEVNPGGVAVAKASPNRACMSSLVSSGMVGVWESRGVDPKRSDLPMARVKRL
jgi:hypothetical protein